MLIHELNDATSIKPQKRIQIVYRTFAFHLWIVLVRATPQSIGSMSSIRWEWLIYPTDIYPISIYLLYRKKVKKSECKLIAFAI